MRSSSTSTAISCTSTEAYLNATSRSAPTIRARHARAWRGGGWVSTAAVSTVQRPPCLLTLRGCGTFGNHSRHLDRGVTGGKLARPRGGLASGREAMQDDGVDGPMQLIVQLQRALAPASSALRSKPAHRGGKGGRRSMLRSPRLQPSALGSQRTTLA